MLRKRCNLIRRGIAYARNSDLIVNKTNRKRSATPLRIARISKMLNPPRANSRIDTAITEKESNAPTIQRTTCAILLLCT